MPVKEVTIFKDGHAFVLHEGSLATDAAGNVLMDYLPSPVLGTFWPYSSSTDAKLVGVVAGQRRVLVEQTALSLAELLEGNPGAEVIITEKSVGPNRDPLRYAVHDHRHSAARASRSSGATGLPNAAPRAPERGSVILVRTADGVKAVGHRRTSRTSPSRPRTRAKRVARGVPQPAHAEARLGHPQAVAHGRRSGWCTCRRACAGFPPTR